LMTTMRVVGECFFWYRLTRVFPDKFHRAVKRLCVCVCVLGFALDLDLQHSSETLLDKMSCLGVCVSYEETNWYKQSTMLFESTGSALEDCFLLSFTHWAGHNVDHNIGTLDGCGTFHGTYILCYNWIVPSFHV